MVKAQRREAAKLYVIPGSHPCRAAMLMLEHKGMDYRRVEIPGGLQAPVVKARRFPGRTVPALRFDGQRVQTNREIARFLDQVQPQPSLFPDGRTDGVEEAERFADEILQPLARRLVLAAGNRDLDSLVDRAGAGRLGALLAHSDRRRKRVIRLATYFFKITDETETLDLAALPGVLDQVDDWIGGGVLNGPQLNAADFQIAPSLALLAYRQDLRPEVQARPVWDLVDRVIPATPGAD